MLNSLPRPALTSYNRYRSWEFSYVSQPCIYSHCCRFFFASAFYAQPPAAPTSVTPQIKGQYLETRSADVYVGQCFANGEMNTAGQEAIVAWHIGEGKWDGVSLDGLTIVGAIKAQATLGHPYGKPYPAKSVFWLTGKLRPNSAQALINFAQEMGGDFCAMSFA